MHNVKLLIEYDGTNFYGWQIQPGLRTVQGELEKVIKKITNAPTKLIGAGRTDQGVHALGQVANFQARINLSPEKLRQAINSLTPDDIYIKKIEFVEEQFNSRYSARSKIYRYHITFIPSPFKIRYNWYVNYQLNIEKMKQALNYLIGEHDYKNFSISNGPENTTCRIMKASLTDIPDGVIIEFEGNRFLRRMVRGMVGFLVDLGRGRFNVQEPAEVWHIPGLYFAPPQGLFLMKVKY
ncbi:tRNA pseudouridine(38-40) synthase TruA [candidate division WOR-3 bacterium 4484_100]|uniref:tRNA pseudouridine synthase A n=1 Tax=candidate division WOR-3 bacterium 4484_100 TaxID=1936077 RepID=A0A1V4QG08_UNCW3|nr:MAG: tRNA pseudouridine(38-40) synthase TruA [candidate division WOR-3 bacterium 4484_100]